MSTVVPLGGGDWARLIPLRQVATTEEAAGPGEFRIEALVANKDVETLAAQARRFRARLAHQAHPLGKGKHGRTVHDTAGKG